MKKVTPLRRLSMSSGRVLAATALVSLAWLALEGCGSNDSVEATWLFTDFGVARECANELVLDGASFVDRTFCKLDNEKVGLMVTAGAYRQTDDALFVTAVRSSCPGTSKKETMWSVSVSKGILTRSIGTKTRAYHKAKAAISGEIVSGCFDDDLSKFNEGPLTEL